MRFVILKDTSITQKQWDKLATEFSDFIKENVGITPTFFVEDYTYQGIPTIIDNDGDVMPSLEWREKAVHHVYSRYGEFGTDHIVLLVHLDNWIFKGIWGTNWSNVYNSYHVHLCRFDNKNSANSFGTLYHEWMHSLDALIKTTTGRDVSAELGFLWDKFAVHGGRPDKEGTTVWKYIRYKENVPALLYISKYLRESYQKRADMYAKHTGLLKQVISLATQYLTILRARRNVKDGVQK